MKRAAARLGLALVLGIGLAGPRATAQDEDEAAARARATLVEAAHAKDRRRLDGALDAAATLVGPSAVFPDGGALADWLGTLPDDVTGLETVRARRAWLYVTSKRGGDALALLDALLEQDATNGVLRAYRGEAKRQTGDLDGAVADLALALDQGATEEHVTPSVKRLVFDLRRFPPKDADPEALPSYVTRAAAVLEKRDAIEVRMAFVEWLAFDATKARLDAPRAARLRAEAVRQAGRAIRLVPAEEDRLRLARMALEAATWRQALGASSTPDLPEVFDLLAAAVRLAESPAGDRHELPEALAFLSEAALAQGRFVLAERLARRRLEFGDSPTARRVLLALPPDVGD